MALPPALPHLDSTPLIASNIRVSGVKLTLKQVEYVRFHCFGWWGLISVIPGVLPYAGAWGDVLRSWVLSGQLEPFVHTVTADTVLVQIYVPLQAGDPWRTHGERLYTWRQCTASPVMTQGVPFEFLPLPAQQGAGDAHRPLSLIRSSPGGHFLPWYFLLLKHSNSPLASPLCNNP